MPNKLRSAYIPHDRKAIAFDGLSMTKQSHKEECDVNTIMLQYQKTGMIEHVRKTRGTYGDYTSAVEYHDAINEVLKAQEMFATVPAHVRKKFDNDPAEFLNFVQNPDNVEEMQKLGLVEASIDFPPLTNEGPSPETPKEDPKPSSE